ncbi:MAG: hypothetical protein AB7E66_01145 [Parvibaculaceae bacterium]
MIRNTVLALAAAATLALTAQAASAHSYGYGHGYGYKSYGYSSCTRVFVGYRTVWTYYGYVQKPIYKKVCGYGY